jgi:hypothetical protein
LPNELVIKYLTRQSTTPRYTDGVQDEYTF